MASSNPGSSNQAQPFGSSLGPSLSQSLAVSSEAPGNDVFISYSRRDKAFVETLAAAFKRLNRAPWVDWDNIRKGEEWWEAIKRGIEAADTFIFVVSPDSVASPVCWDEVEYAAKHKKRFLPIVWREGFDEKRVHPSISSHNWLFFRETDDFEPAFQELLKAMDTDLGHVRAHTRLLVRALEWQNKDRNASYLLRGSDLQDAERWLTQAVDKNPQPTELQSEYINTSHAAQIAQLRARQKAKWTVILTTVLVNMLLAIGGGLWFYRYATEQTTQQLRDNLVRALNVGLIGINGDRFQALANWDANAFPAGNPTSNSPASNLLSSNPLYQEHQDWLYKVHTVIPNATLRSYVQGPEAGEILWIGDVSRVLHSNPTDYRQAYPAQHFESQIFDGVTPRVVVMTPYTDNLGRWVSAVGPIKNSQGQVVGGLKVYFKEDYILQVQAAVRNRLTVAYVIIFVWLLALSLIILRVTRPNDEGLEQRKLPLSQDVP
ncbi:toll/interleukin-1 receptor domain-containing protein [Leptolyngbya sp. FACHB-261]|uniref:toll/interleukin-1 receptor domain-containing protein n=1 Tax=Leptolyngbya sp. FACHB-261 TaxID=2692806 RepID=UPI001683F192|nr:toll/interleukin-1 receptor domain-containing protein [Leptolyngbya sp. FACHB-261]MBD2100145.1 toll/interleukin-1 receptor domain-containing protein [Leptolyngbya sp. FACHB-261]